ncbi:MAG: TlpA family protein disulfide reductase [Acidobacteriia bacterium]|nr:TlpA family protein disulfide reductase [Terriglobia bacterium]
MDLVVFDANGDGVFDRKDSALGTTLGLDLNNDGRIWGASEFRNMEEILEICGQTMQVADLDPSGLSITFRVSELKAPTVNSPVPFFSVSTTSGQMLRSDDFRGRVHLLDFWASWCEPCVAGLSEMDSLARAHPKDLVVVGVDVDEPERRAAADRLIRDKALSFPQVIREQGEKDFLWKMFGSMQGAKLSIPLFVVMDRDGVIRYAGGGDFADLKGLVERLLAPTR